MKSNPSLFILAILAILFVAISGCVQSPPSTGGDLNPTPPVQTPDTPSDIADDLSGGTGSSADDITSEDLDALESDLDELDSAVDEASQSDI